MGVSTAGNDFFIHHIFSETVKFTSFMQICLVVLGFLSFFFMWWSCVIGLKEDKSSEEIFASSTGIFIKKDQRLKPRPLGRRSSRGETQCLIRSFLPVNILTDNRYRSTSAG